MVIKDKIQQYLLLIKKIKSFNLIDKNFRRYKY